jgi:hypothetical protein
MNTVDLTPITQPILTILGTVVTGLLVIYVPKALDAFQKWAGVQLTEQQRQTILGAVQTAAGKIETKLDQGVLQVSQVHVDNPTVRDEAQAAINAVPVAAAALGMTVDGVSRMIVGAADTAAHGPSQPVANPAVAHMTATELARAIVTVARDEPSTAGETK